MRVCLSNRGLATIPWDFHENDFAFVVHRRRFCIPRFVAEMVSPKISRLRRCDASFLEYHLQTEISCKKFKRFLEMAKGGDLSIENDHVCYLRLFMELENEELQRQMVSLDAPAEITVENVVSQLAMKREMGPATPVEPEVDFIAKHFSEMPPTEIMKLSVDSLELVLASGSLRITDEDMLYSTLSKVIKTNGTEYVCLLEHVQFENLSQEAITEFVNDSSLFLKDGMSVTIWSSICRRLVRSHVSSDVQQNGFLCPLDTARPLEGIIRHLSRMYGRNICETGIVRLTGSRPYNMDPNYSNSVGQVAIADRSTYFCSANEPNMWICYDFKNRRIKPTAYTIQSFAGSSGWEHLRSWVIETSTDGTTWTEIDRHENCESLNREHAVASFIISSSSECRMIRLRQIGPNCHRFVQDNKLVLSSWEIFGTVRESS